MTSPVPSTSVVIKGAETTAGSMRNRRSRSGSTAATVADQTQMAAMVSATTWATWAPVPSNSARPKATTAMIAPTISPTATSLPSTRAHITQAHLAQPHSPHQGRGGLTADVATRTDQERNEVRQRHHLGDLVVKGTEHGAGVGLGRKQQQ